MNHTPNGYDPRWLAAINQVLEDRETGIEITDIHESLWDQFIAPMIDAIENCPNNYLADKRPCRKGTV
jgi:hypothetical protein